jgi:AraC-like DNA-binding protein
MLSVIARTCTGVPPWRWIAIATTRRNLCQSGTAYRLLVVRSRLGTTVLDLLTVAVAAHVDRARSVPPETQQRALVPQIRAFIEEHLADPELSPATIAAAHFISVRYLHKLFETEDTTVADLIRRRRLERCRRDLLDPAQQTRPVSAIAARWGFTDPAHFSRLFRATHGIPPAQYRRLATAPPHPN